MLQMGFENSKVYALLYLNRLWAEISSPDVALEILNDPMEHSYVPNDREDPRCQICEHGKLDHHN